MLISCVMPTTLTRWDWIPRALACFAQQDYEDRELVVASEHVTVGRRLPDDPRVRFVQTPPGISLGEKRNLVNAAARGSLIAHWDDDDWYAPWRLSEQVRSLRDAPHGALSGSRTLVFVDLATRALWEYVYAETSRGVHGATLCYPRDVWEASPFKHEGIASDYHFCNGLPPDHVFIDVKRPICVATSHPNNTAPRRFVPPMWRRVDRAQLPVECHDWLNRTLR